MHAVDLDPGRSHASRLDNSREVAPVIRSILRLIASQHMRMKPEV